MTKYFTDVADTDHHDIQASLAGDQEAFARMVARYQGEIARGMWRFTRREDQLAELVQDVFVEAYFSLHSYRDKGPFLHWLKRIGTRVGYRFWKQRDRRRSELPLGDLDCAAPAGDPPDPSAAAELLSSLLSRLGSADRLVLTLQYFEQCSVKEIARRMGWTLGMTKMRAHRARKKLKEFAESQNLFEEM